MELPPTQDASHRQDFEPFLVGNPELNPHVWRNPGWGVDRVYHLFTYI